MLCQILMILLVQTNGTVRTRCRDTRSYVKTSEGLAARRDDSTKVRVSVPLHILPPLSLRHCTYSSQPTVHFLL